MLSNDFLFICGSILHIMEPILLLDLLKLLRLEVSCYHRTAQLEKCGGVQVVRSFKQVQYLILVVMRDELALPLVSDEVLRLVGDKGMDDRGFVLGVLIVLTVVKE